MNILKCSLVIRPSILVALSLSGFMTSSLLGQVGGFNLPGGIPGNIPGNFVGPVGFSPEADVKRFSYGLSLNATYNSNINLQGGSGDGLFSVNVGGSLSYQIGESEHWNASLRYSPNYQIVLSGRDIPGAFQQNASLSLGYQGGSLSASLNGNFGSGGGQNVVAGGFVDSTNYGFNGSLSWKVSPITSFSLNAGWQSTDLGQQGANVILGPQSANTNLTYGLSASWQVTPLVSLGPFVTLGQNDLSFGTTLDSTTYGLSLGYQLSGMTSLNLSVGLQNQSFGMGGSNDAFFGSLNFSWAPNDLYRVAISAGTTTVGLPGAGGQFVNNYNMNANISRNLGTGSLAFNLGLNLGAVESVNQGAATQANRDFVNYSLNYSRPLFEEEINFNASVGYNQGFSGQDFSGIISSLGLSYAF